MLIAFIISVIVLFAGIVMGSIGAQRDHFGLITAGTLCVIFSGPAVLIIGAVCIAIYVPVR